MKKIVYLVLITFVFSNCTDKQKSKTIENSIVKDNQEEFAQGISHKILSAQKAGGFYKFSEGEATARMVDGLNENLQKQTYTKIKNIFGDYESIKLDTVFQITKDKTFQVYRFKGSFETTDEVEVRAVLDLDGKLAGFFVFPWKDAL